jgi:hypothetical protein
MLACLTDVLFQPTKAPISRTPDKRLSGPGRKYGWRDPIIGQGSERPRGGADRTERSSSVGDEERSVEERVGIEAQNRVKGSE